MRIQALLPGAAIEAFHHGVACGPVRPAEIEFDNALIGPSVRGFGGELAAIIDLNCGRQPTAYSNTVERVRDVFFFEASHDIDGQAFPGVVVDHRQCTQASSVEERISYKKLQL